MKRIFLILSTLYFSACFSESKPKLIGEWIPETENVKCDSPLGIFNKDKTKMLFWRRVFDHKAGMPYPTKALHFLNTSNFKIISPLQQPQLSGKKNAYKYQPSKYCWSPSGEEFFVKIGVGLTDRQGNWYKVDFNQKKPTLEETTNAPTNCNNSREEKSWFSHAIRTHTEAIKRGLKVQEQGCCTVELIDENGSILASHSLGFGLHDYIYISQFQLSPRASKVVYNLGKNISWWFSSPQKTYILNTESKESILLDKQVYDYIWLDEKRIIGCSKKNGGKTSLIKWQTK